MGMHQWLGATGCVKADLRGLNILVHMSMDGTLWSIRNPRISFPAKEEETRTGHSIDALYGKGINIWEDGDAGCLLVPLNLQSTD